MITSRDLRTYVVNLPRRSDRRRAMTRTLPDGLEVIFTSDWGSRFDGRHLSVAELENEGCALFPWRIESDNPWWNRPLKYGEIGCTLAHLACWDHAAANGDEPYVLILEDDAMLPPTSLSELLCALNDLAGRASFDLLYLGRDPLEPDRPAPVPGFVVPGYSHCTFGYLLTRAALRILLDTHLEKAIVPVDEFLPALYIDHPRTDLMARFPRRLNALACEPALVRQRPKDEAGSDTEDSAFVTQR